MRPAVPGRVVQIAHRLPRPKPEDLEAEIERLRVELVQLESRIEDYGGMLAHAERRRSEVVEAIAVKHHMLGEAQRGADDE